MHSAHVPRGARVLPHLALRISDTREREREKDNPTTGKIWWREKGRNERERWHEVVA